jgi:hypothetical protein
LERTCKEEEEEGGCEEGKEGWRENCGKQREEKIAYFVALFVRS